MGDEEIPEGHGLPASDDDGIEEMDDRDSDEEEAANPADSFEIAHAEFEQELH